MPKFRWNYNVTVTNRLGDKVSVAWYGISCGRFFFGMIRGDKTS